MGRVAELHGHSHALPSRGGRRSRPTPGKALGYNPLCLDERPSIRDEKTLAWIKEQEESGRTRCELGYDSPFDPNV